MSILESLIELASNGEYPEIVNIVKTSLVLILFLSLIIKILFWKSNLRLFKLTKVHSKRLMSVFNQSMKSPYDDKFPSLKKWGNYFGIVTMYFLSLGLFLYGMTYGLMMASGKSQGMLADLVLSIFAFVMFVGARYYKVQGDKLLHESKQICS